jgi:hypothetical protein
MNRKQLFAIALALAGTTSVFAQEATSDSWQQVAAGKSVEQVRTELAQARKDGTIRSWSAGYIEKVQSVKSREQIRAEAATALRNGEVDAINNEAHAFAAPTDSGTGTVLARAR